MRGYAEEDAEMRAGDRVEVTVTTNCAARSDQGTLIELRGWNFEFGKRINRWAVVWIDRCANGRPTNRGISISDRMLRRIA